MPLDMEQYMENCSQEMEPEVITVTQTLQLDFYELEPWMCPATNTARCTDVECERVASPVKEIRIETPKKVQEEDPVIGKVREFIIKG